MSTEVGERASCSSEIYHHSGEESKAREEERLFASQTKRSFLPFGAASNWSTTVFLGGPTSAWLPNRRPEFNS